MNSREVSAAAERVFVELSKLSEKEFRRKLEEHADGDIANALIDLHYFEVGEIESEAFQFEAEQIPSVALNWHAVTFDYHVNLSSTEFTQIQFAREDFNYLTQSALITYVLADTASSSNQEYHVKSKESEPWRVAA